MEEIELDLQESDVTPEKPKRTLKGLASKIFTSDEVKEEIEAPKRGRPKKGTKFFASKSALFTAGAISLLSVIPGLDKTFMIGNEVKTFAPTAPQMTSIIDPLLRIADRHANISEINPDVSDIAESFLAVIAYSFDLRANIMLYKMLQEEEEKRNDELQKENRFASKRVYSSSGPSVEFADE